MVTMSVPAVIAHRGASAYAPENTLAAFQLAAEMGAGYIETDLRYTREGRFVLLHDTRVNRTTGGRGRIAQMDFATVRRLDAGSWFSPGFAGERIPTLEEGLALAEECGLGIYLELKAALDASLRLSLLGKLRRSVLERITLLSFRPSALQVIRAAEPRLKTALLIRRAGPAIETAVRSGTPTLAPHRRRVSARLVASAHRAGLGVVTWTVNGPRELRRMIGMGIEGIMTDQPDRLVELLRQSKETPFSPEAHAPESSVNRL
jgi:glycerophosphoryl diester phosphodiesterase